MRLHPTALGLLALLGWLAAIPSAAHAEDLRQRFEEGNAHAFEGRFAEAVAAYETLVDAGVQDAAVYYNLGIAHAHLGQLGYAVLYLERAAHASGGDDDIEQALYAVREALGKRTAEREGEALVRTRPPLLDALLERFPASLLAVVLLGCTWLLFLALCGLLLPSLRRYGLQLGVVAVAAGVLAVLGGGALLVRTGALQTGEQAVIVATDGELREGPDPRARSRGALAEGGLARVVDREGDWVRIRTDRGLDGWTPGVAVGVVP